MQTITNESTRWAAVHLDAETEHAAALATLEMLRGVQAQIEALKLDEGFDEKALALHWTKPLADFNPKYIDFVVATLGVGEVRIFIDGGKTRMEETGIPALWRVQEPDGSQHFTLALIPNVVLRAARLGLAEIPEVPVPEGVFAAPAILQELQTAREKTDTQQLEFMPAYMTELSRQPLSPEDRQYLEDVLGKGDIEILLTSFAQVYMTNTRVQGIWHTATRNKSGKALLDAYLVGLVPPEVPASSDELLDALAKCKETIEWIEEDLERGAL